MSGDGHQDLSVSEDQEPSVDGNLGYLFPVEYQENVSNLSSENLKLKMELGRMFELLKAMEKEPSNVELGDRLAQEIREKLAIGRENDQLKDQVAVLERANKELEQAKKDLLEQLKKKETEMELLQKQRENDDDVRLQQENADLRERLEDLQNESKEKSSKIMMLESKLKEKAASEVSNQSLNEEIQKLKDANTALESEKHRIEDESKEKSSKIAMLESKLKEKAASEASNQSLNEEIQKLKDANAALESEKHRLKDESKENAEFKSKLATLEGEIQRLNDENQKMLKENENNLEKIHELEAQIQEQKSSQAEGIEKFDEVMNEKRRLEEEKNDLASKLHELEEAMGKHESNDGVIDKLTEENEKLKETNEYLTNENSGLHAENQECHSKILELEKQLKEGQDTAAQNAELRAENERLALENQQLNTKNAEMKHQIEGITDELDQLQQQFGEKGTQDGQAELTRLKGENQLLQERIDELNDTLMRIQDDLDQLLEAFDVETAGDAVNKLSLFLNESSKLRSEKEELMRRQKELEDEIAELRAQLQDSLDKQAHELPDVDDQGIQCDKMKDSVDELSIKDEASEKQIAMLVQQKTNLEYERQEMVEALLSAKAELEQVKVEQQARMSMTDKDNTTSPGTPKKSKIPTPSKERPSPLSEKIAKTESELDAIRKEKDNCMKEIAQQETLIDLLASKLRNAINHTIKLEKKITSFSKKACHILATQDARISTLSNAHSKLMPTRKCLSILQGLADAAWKESSELPPNITRMNITTLSSRLLSRINQLNGSQSPNKAITAMNPRVVRLIQQVRSDFGSIANDLRVEHEELMSRISEA